MFIVGNHDYYDYLLNFFSVLDIMLKLILILFYKNILNRYNRKGRTCNLCGQVVRVFGTRCYVSRPIEN